jgi:ATP-dependent Clp protease ATP-binding subunit ClpC
VSSRFTQKAQNSLNRAMQCARELGHTYIGSEHLLLGLAGESDSIAAKLLAGRGITPAKLRQTIADWAGTGVPTTLSPSDMTPKVKNIIETSAQESIKNGQSYIGTEHLLAALLAETDCMAIRILSACGVSVTELKKELGNFLETIPGKNVLREQRGRNNLRQALPGAPTISNYGRNLTQLARLGLLDPIIGRERETMRVIQILSRRTKNNPCLIGEPGVGKTAVVEGLAQKIADGRVPENLRDKVIVTLDIPAMIAGAKYRGEFEERMKNVWEEVRKNDSIILFIDEIHTIIGAGAAEGAVDAANIIKPALSRSELQVIGATTLTEYRKHIEKDAALERRFQPVMVGEPTAEETIAILRGLRDKYEAHHKLSISDEAIEAAVRLSQRYITDRFLPDKAIDLIDEAASACRIAAFSAPPALAAVKERLASIVSEKEEAIISQNFEKAAALRDEELKLTRRLDEEKKFWEVEYPENIPTVTAEDIERTLTQWTGIPVSHTDEAENQRILELDKRLKERIIGQDAANEKIAAAIRRGRSGLKDPRRPAGSFLFCGRTGVGKTELARAVSEEVFGKDNFIRFDMSEYMEKHSISKLIGSPPGYVGYDEGGRLTESVRRHPYSVVLFDEIEKAHPDIFNILLQILDNGRLTDSQGRTTDFRNTIIILTSNIGFSARGKTNQLGFGSPQVAEREDEDERQVIRAVSEAFRPEFLNRLDEIIVFKPLSNNDIKQITFLTLREVADRARALGIDVEFSDSAIELISKKGYSRQYGARNLRRTVVVMVEDRLSSMILEGKIKSGDSVIVSTGAGDEIAVLINQKQA